MESDKSAWFLSLKTGVARANVEKHKEQIWKLRADIDSAFEKLQNIDINAWREEGALLLKQMEDAGRDLESLEINVGVSKVAGGTAAVLGGVFSIMALVSGATLPLAVVGAVIETAGGITSAGGELFKHSAFKSRLDNLSSQYDNFSKKTQYLCDVVNELLELLNEVWQLIDRIFGSFNLMQEEARKTLNLQESFPEQVWQDVDALSAEESVVLEAVGAIKVQDKEVIMTRIGMALRSLSKSLTKVHVAGRLSIPEPTGVHTDFSSHLNNISMVKTGICILNPGAEAMLKSDGAVKDRPKGSSAVISIGSGIWDVMKGVKSLQQGSRTAKLLWQNVQRAKDSISLVEEALEVVTVCISS